MTGNASVEPHGPWTLLAPRKNVANLLKHDLWFNVILELYILSDYVHVNVCRLPRRLVVLVDAMLLLRVDML